MFKKLPTRLTTIHSELLKRSLLFRSKDCLKSSLKEIISLDRIKRQGVKPPEDTGMEGVSRSRRLGHEVPDSDFSVSSWDRCRNWNCI